MRIKTITLIAITAFALLMGALSAEFYNLDRQEVLRYIATGTQQNVFRLEDDVKKILQQEKDYKLQALLDRVVAIDLSIKDVSISIDNKTIAYSSSRSQIHKPIQKKFIAISDIRNELTHNNELYYKSDFDYFSNTQRHSVYLLIELDQGYVYGQLNRLAWMYGMGLFIFMLGVIIITFIGVRQLIVLPLEKITQMAQKKDQKVTPYFIKELNALSQTLAITFKNLWLQQIKIEEAMEETRYLDRIMRTIADINEYLVSSSDINELMQKCTKRLSEHQGYGACWIALVKGDALEVGGCTKGLKDFLHVGMKIRLNAEELIAFAPSIEAFNSGSAVMLQ